MACQPPIARGFSMNRSAPLLRQAARYAPVVSPVRTILSRSRYFRWTSLRNCSPSTTGMWTSRDQQVDLVRLEQGQRLRCVGRHENLPGRSSIFRHEALDQLEKPHVIIDEQDFNRVLNHGISCQ